MERRSYEKDGFVYLLDDNQTAWIREGSTGGQRYRLPESIDVAGKSYMITDTDIGAFCDEPNLEELIVPDCYKYIDEDSFGNVLNLVVCILDAESNGFTNGLLQKARMSKFYWIRTIRI